MGARSCHCPERLQDYINYEVEVTTTCEKISSATLVAVGTEFIELKKSKELVIVCCASICSISIKDAFK